MLAQWKQHPIHRTFTSGKQGSREARTVPPRLRRAKAPAHTRAEGLRAIPARLQGGRTSRRRRPQAPERRHTCVWGGWRCGLGVQVARFSFTSPRKTPSPVSRPRAAPPVPRLRTYPQANLPRLHVKASSAAPRKLILGPWLAPVNPESFRVAALLGGRLPWKPGPWRG